MNDSRNVEAASALPVGAVVRDARGWVWVRRPKGWQTCGRGGYTLTGDLPMPVTERTEAVP